ncbi:MAG: GNAT family N-acetyltransferase [Chitinophagaceae bacterium]
MIHDINFPHSLSGLALDHYLARGWFRMGHTIFTTHLIYLEEQFYPVYWLRIRLHDLHWGKRQRLIQRTNSSFEVQCTPLLLTEEMDELYERYRQSVDFATSPSLIDYLFNGRLHQVFDTRMIEVRDEGKLIAAGIFDKGARTIAGIINFFDPDYAKFSLGKYLMLLKAEWAREHGHLFYYPGYLAVGFKKFDYKLWLQRSATEYFDPHSQQWLPAITNPIGF